MTSNELGLIVFENEGECAVCPELAIADISPQEVDSRFDPEQTKRAKTFRTAKSVVLSLAKA
jgi:hypothetical protein